MYESVRKVSAAVLMNDRNEICISSLKEKKIFEILYIELKYILLQINIPQNFNLLFEYMQPESHIISKLVLKYDL